MVTLAVLVGCVGEPSATRDVTGPETTTLDGAAPAPEVSEVPPAGPQTKCPVTGAPVDTKDPYVMYLDHEGKRIYFCTPNCADTFSTDPQKYLKRLKEMGVTLEDAPTATKNLGN